MEGLSSGGRRPVVESLMRPLVVVLVDPASDGIAGFSERLVFVKPDFFLLERAVKAFDAAVAFGWLAHLYVFCKGGDSCCRLCGSHLGLATLIDSHRALFSESVLRDPITARLARPPIALHHGACAALVPIREPLTTFFLNPVHHCDNVKV